MDYTGETIISFPAIYFLPPLRLWQRRWSRDVCLFSLHSVTLSQFAVHQCPVLQEGIDPVQHHGQVAEELENVLIHFRTLKEVGTGETEWGKWTNNKVLISLNFGVVLH